MTKSKLRRNIIEETGIAPSASSHVVVSYQFDFSKRRFKEEITSIHYLFRAGGFRTGSAQELDLLYLSPTNHKWVRELLRKASGISSNPAFERPFYQQLSFLRLLETADAEILQIGGERASEREKEELIDRVRQTAGLSK